MFKTEIGQILNKRLFFIKIYPNTLNLTEGLEHLEVGREYLARFERDSLRDAYDMVFFSGTSKHSKGREVGRISIRRGANLIEMLLSTISDKNAFRNAVNALTNYRDGELKHIEEKKDHVKHHVIPVSLFNTKRLLIEVTSMGFFEVNQKENIRLLPTKIHEKGHVYYTKLVEEWINKMEAEIDAMSDMNNFNCWNGDTVYTAFMKVLATANAYLQAVEERETDLQLRDL